ncbi:MAG: response regulator [Candidatus Hodarchaeota archaeon]
MNPLILIVDDNVDLLLNLQMTLEFNNYKVLSAENGKEALKILKEIDYLPELIISDIMMPKMNGYELFKTVSKNSRWNSVPFLFLSAYSPTKEDIIDNNINTNDIIIKPFKEDELLRIISDKITMK